MVKIFLLIALAMLCNCASEIELNTGWRQDSREEKTCAIVLHPEEIRLSYLGKYILGRSQILHYQMESS
jgi:hypothetical protein